MRLPPSPPQDPELTRLLEWARQQPPMTRDQLRAQARSWVIGNMGLDYQEMTREEIVRIVDEIMERSVLF